MGPNQQPSSQSILLRSTSPRPTTSKQPIHYPAWVHADRCVYVYIYTYTNTHTNMHMQVCVHTGTFMHIHVHLLPNIHRCVCLCVCIPVSTHVCASVYLPACLSVSVCTHVCRYVRMLICTSTKNVNECMHVSVCAFVPLCV